MAFDLKTFRVRTLTAIVFAAVMLTGLLWNRAAFIVLFLVVHFGCWSEFLRLMKKIMPGKTFIHYLTGLLYLTLPITLFFFIRLDTAFTDDNLLKVVPCGIIFSIWINDTMAYISGSLIGKTPLSRISPKKTVEGTLGGIILSVTVITIIGSLTGYFRTIDWFFISLISAVTGTFGDLLESKIKRLAGVKDSGNIMPGHGGFLDRFDSLLVAIPFVFVYYFLMIR
ncbi:MAG: phosphatidate cytidylyltransferase [Chitinophagaceae bacterium]|nr:phosphatidate cytidylyltransferase [Chitinophagaceae bacterium]